MSGAPLLCLLGLVPWLSAELGPLPAGVEPRSPRTVASATQAQGRPSPKPIASREAARYRISMGGVGALGELTVSLTPGDSGSVRATGAGRGSLFGVGSFERSVDAEFDPARGSRRWTSTRVNDGRTTVDQVQQDVPGVLHTVRRRTGRPDDAAVVSRQRPVLDPLGFLLRVRLAPPGAAPETLELMDGRALWVVTLAPARPGTLAGPASPRTLRIDGEAQPVHWDGTPDTERSRRKFVLHLSADPFHTPLRMEMPVGFARVEVDLVALDRPGTMPESFLDRPGRALLRLMGRLAPKSAPAP